MLTREEVLAIEDYCSENKVTHKARLAELDIPFWDFYKAKKKYRETDLIDTGPGQFVQLSSGRCVPGRMPSARTPGRAGKQEKQPSARIESYLTIELQTRCGTAMRVEMGRLRIPFFGETDDIAGDFKYEDLIFMAKSAMESPYVKRMKMLLANG